MRVRGIRKTLYACLAFTLALGTFCVEGNTAYARGESAYETGDISIFYESSSKGESKTFEYNGKIQTYTISTSNIYTIVVSGAAGDDFSNDYTVEYIPDGDGNISVGKKLTYSGGAGTVISGTLALNKGDVLTVELGGKGKGTNSADSSNGAAGGKATVLKVNDEVILVAGGGGGASVGGQGTGSSEYVRSEYSEMGKGHEGISSGGDGALGGNAGTVSFHKHSGDNENGGPCYKSKTVHVHDGNQVKGGLCYAIPNEHKHIIQIYETDEKTGDVTMIGSGKLVNSDTGEEYTWDGNEIDDQAVSYTKIGCFSNPVHIHQNSCKNEDGQYVCGDSPLNGYGIGCGRSAGDIDSYFLTCDKKTEEYTLACKKTENMSPDSHVPATGGISYVAPKFNLDSISDYNTGDGSLSISASAVQTYIAPCDGTYIITTSDGKYCYQGKIHFNAGDVITLYPGREGTSFKSYRNGKNLLWYHYHTANNTYHPSEETVYQWGNPGGCFTKGSHTCNILGYSCSRHSGSVSYSYYVPCGYMVNAGGPWSDTSHAGFYYVYVCPKCGYEERFSGSPMGRRCPNGTTVQSSYSYSYTAHARNGAKVGTIPEAVGTGQGTHAKSVSEALEPNTWQKTCGYTNGQIITTGFTDEHRYNETGQVYYKIELYSIDYGITVNPNGGYWSQSWKGTESTTTRTETTAKDTTLKTQTDKVVTIPNPVREGFTFMGWDIYDMDSYTHYFAPSSSAYAKETRLKNSGYKVNDDNYYSVSAESSNEKELSYSVVNSKYRYFMNLRRQNGTCIMKAVWMDDSDPVLNDLWGDDGATFRNYDMISDQLIRTTDHMQGTRSGIINTPTLLSSNTGSDLNPDSGLALFTRSTPYTITRYLGSTVLVDGPNLWKTFTDIIKSDGKGNAIYRDIQTYDYNILHSNKIYPQYIIGLQKNAAGKYTGTDTSSVGKYPYIYGTTSDGQRYYPGTWTNKSVTITATAYDGVTGTGTNSVPNRNGGTGIYRMRFDDYARIYEGSTERQSDDWIVTSKSVTSDSTADSSMEIEKTFSASGAYQITISAEDRAGEGNDAERGSWLPNPNGNNKATYRYGYYGSSNSLDLSTAILIDKDAPVIMDPENYINSTASQGTAITNIWGNMTYKQAKAMMYEGYNDVVEPGTAENESYGWSMDYVRITIYADDGDGSGINKDDPAFCWVPEGSGIDYKDPSNWQSADSTRTVNGKLYNVSTRVVAENEKGVVYVRDAVGNYSKVNYTVDHIDQQEPETFPALPPIDPEPDRPDPPNPTDPTDPENPEPQKPDDSDPLGSIIGKGELLYDWTNKDATITINARDIDGSTSGQSISGIWKIVLYRSDSEFTTVEDERGRKRPEKYLNSPLKMNEFLNELQYTESKEGISYYMLEIFDKAGNITTVSMILKIDKTYPGVPYRASADADNGSAFSTENGVINSVGNDILGNFPGESFITGKFWDIKQVDLNEVDYDMVESFITNEDNMKCSFNFKIYDQNWTGSYADPSLRATDDSGFDRITLRLIDTDNDSIVKSYVLYNYLDRSKEGINSDGNSFALSHSGIVETNENDIPYLKSELTGTPLSAMIISAQINTFVDFPDTSALNYELEIVDRAGNIKTYLNQPGNEIRNFSIKAVIFSAEQDEFTGNVIDEFNEDVIYNEQNTVDNKVSVTRYYYEYQNRRGEKRLYSYKLSNEEMAALGLTGTGPGGEPTIIAVPLDIEASTSNAITAKTNIPYFQLGDIGYVDIWTVGYVSAIQFNFSTLGDNVGTEMINEIEKGFVPPKYNLGVIYDTKYERRVPYQSGEKLAVSYAPDNNGVYFATHYGVNEAIDTQNGWLSEGTSIRIPPYLLLVQDGISQDDQTPTYESELHPAAFYALKGQWKDASTARYVIYDTRANDIHYRITHE